MSPIGSFRDKLTILRLRQGRAKPALCAQTGGGNRTTLEALDRYGFSAAMRERFLRPFLGGVFLINPSPRPAGTLNSWAAFRAARLRAAGRHGRDCASVDLLTSSRFDPPTCTCYATRRQAGQLLASGERLSADAVVLA